MTNPDTIAHLIRDEVDCAWQAEIAFSAEQVFIDEESGKNLLRLRFLVAVMHRLLGPDENARQMLDALLIVETFLSPALGPDPESAEVAAETLLNFAQNIYDEFRTE
jgi:hypothetical protein